MPATSAFALPRHLSAKSDPALIEEDDSHFAAIAQSLDDAWRDLTARLEAERMAPGRSGQAALERDLEIRRLSARLRAVRRFGLDLCLGKMVPADGTGAIYIGRLGLTDDDGRRLLVDWRSPAAAPFFGATHADPHGLLSRRRYRWSGGLVSDYWDEVFATEDLQGHAALDEQSAFLASLGGSRSARMRDVLGTIQSDQDAAIRADSRGALVIDGGPGTGKTVVALHRAAYLLYADPQVEDRRGGVLVVGPHRPYLEYVSDVLPSLGEDGVQVCTLGDLVPEGAIATPEADPVVARLKSSARMIEAVDRAVAVYEEPPEKVMSVVTSWDQVWLFADDWARAFTAPDPGTPHNEARPAIREELLAILAEKHDDDVPEEPLRRELRRDRELMAAVDRAWPLLDPRELVGDLWEVPAYLRHCAPWLDREERSQLRRAEAQAWTVADLPLLDAARRRLGDAGSEARQRRVEAAVSDRRDRMADVVADLVAADDSDLQTMRMLRGADLGSALVEEAVEDRAPRDPLAGPFSHVVVDEAQELTDAEWQMVLARCPSRSLTVVGDRAQARRGFTESWQERLGRVGLGRPRSVSLSLNYRTPQEVMSAAEPVIRSVLPDANVPTSVRHGGCPVERRPAQEREVILAQWLAEHAEGTACVIGGPEFDGGDRVRTLSAVEAKGLEFDLVLLAEPQPSGHEVTDAVDRYVAMTRATQRLVILEGGTQRV